MPSALSSTALRPIGQLADAAGAKSAADDEALRVAPLLQPQEAANDLGELLGEVLDRALDDAGRLGLAAPPGCRPASSCRSPRWPCRRADPRRACFNGLRHLSSSVPERPLAGLVADEAVLVLDLDVVALDLDGREDRRPMRGQLARLRALLGHERASVRVVAFSRLADLARARSLLCPSPRLRLLDLFLGDVRGLPVGRTTPAAPFRSRAHARSRRWPGTSCRRPCRSCDPSVPSCVP